MKTPAHWKYNNLIARLLLPLGVVYAGLTALRLKIKKARKVNVPVICIGNLTAGGTGKTPTAVAIADIVAKLGLKPCFVSRGYGGKLSGVMVDCQKHTPLEVGDEPLLLARQAPVAINPNRYEAACQAIQNGAEVIIMDDGFQNPGLVKDIAFLVFDGGFGIGNAYPLPAGPLRENFADGLKRANAVIIIGQDTTGLAQKLGDMPIFYAQTVSRELKLATKRVIAFAGIGRPEKFYTSLRNRNLELVATFDFPDHHYYTATELNELLQKARSAKAELVTTAKDFVKIPAELQKFFKVLEIDVVWDNPQQLIDFIKKRLKKE